MTEIDKENEKRNLSVKKGNITCYGDKGRTIKITKEVEERTEERTPDEKR